MASSFNFNLLGGNEGGSMATKSLQEHHEQYVDTTTFEPSGSIQRNFAWPARQPKFFFFPLGVIHYLVLIMSFVEDLEDLNDQ